MECCRMRRIRACSFRSRLDNITAVVQTVTSQLSHPQTTEDLKPDKVSTASYYRQCLHIPASPVRNASDSRGSTMKIRPMKTGSCWPIVAGVGRGDSSTRTRSRISHCSINHATAWCHVEARCGTEPAEENDERHGHSPARTKAEVLIREW